jgi:hypothetical protein
MEILRDVRSFHNRMKVEDFKRYHCAETQLTRLLLERVFFSDGMQ